jgi:hypothetical protein
MIEYTNGQFGAMAPARDIVDSLLSRSNLDEIKAVHFGSPMELQNIRSNKSNIDSIAERISEVEKELKTLRPQEGLIKIYDSIKL